jgi:DNA-binding NarL/FixJ family response regulator
VIKDVYGIDIGLGFRVVGEAGSGTETIGVVRSFKPDMLLLDLAMPHFAGLHALRELGASLPPTLLIAGAVDMPDLLTAIQLGAGGLILKSTATEELFEAMLRVTGGGCWLDDGLVTDLIQSVRPLLQPARAAFGLTAREQDVLRLAATGCSNKEIARQCAVSEETIKHHLTHIFDKVGASNRAQLVSVASRCGLADDAV